MHQGGGAHRIDAAARARDEALIRRALALAERGWGQTAPNPMVGAVLVAGDEVVGEGFHARYGDAHAEVIALRNAGDRARGATLYVTLEPCAHHGKTPPCADAIIAAGVARVVVAVRDLSAAARGGVERLRAAGITVDVGVERQAALELNAAFFNAQCNDRPWVTLKLALSADGAVADPVELHRWITGPSSRAQVHRLRANADAIAVGIGTVLADDPSLTVRDAPSPRVAPARVVFDRSLRLPPSAVLVRTAHDVSTIVMTDAHHVDAARREVLVAAGVDVIPATTLPEALEALAARDVRSLFLEAGPRLSGAFLMAGLVDRVIIFRSSLVLGRTAPRAFEFAPPGFETLLQAHRVVRAQRFDDDVMTSYALREIVCSPD